MKINAYLCCVFLFFTFYQVSQAQNLALPKVLKSQLANANILSKAFFSPAMNGYAANLNNGWFNTAEVHKLGKFDIRIVGTNAFVGEDEKTFDARTLGLTDVTISGNATSSPTIFGPDVAGQTIIYNPQGREVLRYDLPEGIGIGFAPALFLQANVGLPKGTELMVRFFPSISISDLDGFGLWGVGIKHNIKQWIRGMNLWPIDLSVGFGYTASTIRYKVSLLPEVDINTGQPFPGSLPNSSYNNQRFEFKTNAYNFALLISKRLSVISFFGGPRFDIGNSTFSTLGLYPISTPAATNENINNPISIKTKLNQIGFNAGFRLQLGFFALFADGVLSKYSSINGGIAFGSFNKF